MKKIYPAMLSGGSGSRLWPLSRSKMPKQLVALLSDRSLLQETALRLAGLDDVAPPLVIANTDHRFMIAEQLQELAIQPTSLVLEPVGRNTAAAAAVASVIIGDLDPEGIVLLLPADHYVGDVEGLRAAIRSAATYADRGHIVTFGIKPRSPETGYGYIKRGEPLGDSAFAVAEFCEKPDLARATVFLEEGSYDWNSGMFMGRADVLMAEMAAHCPEILSRCKEAVRKGYRDLDFLRLDSASFEACESAPFDTAVMERTRNSVVLHADIGWTDVGSWNGLWDLSAKDNSGNALSGDAIALHTENTFIRAEGRLVAALGVKDLIIVDTGDVVLIADRKRAQDVRDLVTELADLGRSEHVSHTRVHRPWGYFESIETGDRYQVKHLMVKPGGALSLQKHYHRAEHWVVVRGTARVAIDNKELLLSENESTYIPIGAQHRLENPGRVPLSIIEVQSGAYLGEDDIVRLQDVYGRAPK